jgi:hypothetical protein
LSRFLKNLKTFNTPYNSSRHLLGELGANPCEAPENNCLWARENNARIRGRGTKNECPKFFIAKNKYYKLGASRKQNAPNTGALVIFYKPKYDFP